ncbi:MAG: dihydropteroate synthase [Hyphomicrobiaceae bacterium]|nr:dihydropteroate synthase [Hyphomicrobiaceae bacterium]
MPQTYLRPVGLMSAALAGEAETEAYNVLGLPLSNTGRMFAAVETAERSGASVRRRTMAVAEVFQREWADPVNLGEVVEHLTEPRGRFAGLDLTRPRIMGILNVTPDSFSDGGQHVGVERAVSHALAMVAAGADIIDVGGESTRPGSDAVALDEELARVVPVIKAIREISDVVISIDTRKADVMRAAARAGADILNDVSALTHDPAALAMAERLGLPVILMHAQGDPKTMNDDPRYGDLVLDVYDFLSERIAACEAVGIPRSKLCVDPGIGFGKHLKHNVAMMASLSILHGLGVPVLLGASRKKMIGQLWDVPDPKDRVPGSLATVLAGAEQGVQLFRVHDVAETAQALAVWRAATEGK